jgi:type VI secretion system secreted protein Hcp
MGGSTLGQCWARKWRKRDVAVYVKFEGTNMIRGSVTTKGYEGWSEAHTLQWGIARDVKIASHGIQRESSEPTVSEVVITKLLDTASWALVDETFSSKITPRIDFAFTRTERDQVATFLKIRLDECILSGYSFSTNEEGLPPLETISINYAKIELDYAVPGPDGTVHGRYKSGFDLLKVSMI